MASAKDLKSVPGAMPSTSLPPVTQWNQNPTYVASEGPAFMCTAYKHVHTYMHTPTWTHTCKELKVMKINFKN